jgi:hypothetical protein
MKFRNLIAVLFLAITLSMMTSCGEPRVPLTDDQIVYAGIWEAPGDLMIKISADGGGDFKLSSSNVSGGDIVFNENGFVIGFFGIEENFVIEQEPTEMDGLTTMVVNGIKFTKAE